MNNYTLEMTEDEAKALSAIVAYGSVGFLQKFIAGEISKDVLDSGSKLVYKIAEIVDNLKEAS